MNHKHLYGIAFLVFLLIVLAVASKDRPLTPPSDTSVAPSTKSTTPQMLQVAADVRHYLRDQDIPALVVAANGKLQVTYKGALIDYVPDTFFRQQGTEGMARIANAGFDRLVLEAYDDQGRLQSKTFSLDQYRR